MPYKISSKTLLMSRPSKLKFVPATVAIAILLTTGLSMQLAHADKYDDQIRALQAQNAQTQSTVGQLQSQARNYNDAISRLQSQISSIESQIATNEAKQVDLQNQIVLAQQELEQQKKELGQDLKSMYVNGQMTTVEMLATSKSLNEFVDAETYRNAVQNKIQATLAQIAKLQVQLKDQQTQVVALLITQRDQQSQLSSAKNEQSRLLAMNESQQAQYNDQIVTNQAQMAQLRQQQVAANLAGSKGIFYGSACDLAHGDTYPSPLCSSAQDSLVDQWGLLNRECVSYVAWKEFSTGHTMPYGLGNAGDWPSNVPHSWITNNPQPGDAAVRPANHNLYFGNEQDVGHVMYIEEVHSDGTMAVSQYNASLNGTYSYVSSKSMSGLVFIHFPQR